jgi:phage terminase large subunit-like protein
VANKYVTDVLAGKIPAGKHVIEACQRQKDDLARWSTKAAPFQFNKDRANDVCGFIEKLPHIKGPLAGTAIQLEPWQVFILTTTFGWVTKDGYRRFRRSYVEVPRGNGKSCFTSALALYMMGLDGEGGAECYSFATTRDQAKIVFNDAKQMARKSPGLCKALGIEVNAHVILQPDTASKLEAQSAEGSTLDGLNTHFAAIDELHAHRSRDVYDVTETSTGKRKQSLLWVITTAGTNRSGICYEVRGFVLKVLNGSTKDESQFGIVYGLDDGDDWATEAALIKANPNWGVSVMPEVLLPLQAKAMAMPSAANNFKTKHLNEWCNADVSWMDMRAWDACKDVTLDKDQFIGQPCYVGLDLASKVDIAAKVRLFPRAIDGKTHYYVFGDYYLPSETVEKAENSQYQGWEQLKLLTSTPGAVTDFGTIEEELAEDASMYQVEEILYDPFQATQLATRMLEQGMPMVEMRATVLNFSEPMKQLEALVLEGRLHHDGDPVLEWMVSNVVCHTDAKDNIYPRKERNENKIDGVVATIMALASAMQGAKNETATPELIIL